MPRLCVSLPEHRRSIPLGATVWGTTHLILPPEVPGSRFRNALTGEETVREGDAAVLRVAELFRTLPVAMGLVDG